MSSLIYVPNRDVLCIFLSVFFGVFFKILNASDRFNRMTHRRRLAVNIAFLVAGLGIVAVSVYASFSLAIVGIVFIGIFSSFGESILIGFLNLFPPELTGAWSSGTGMAGVGGTLFYLGARSIISAYTTDDLKINQIVFLILIPQAAFYWFAFVRVSASLEQQRSIVRADKSELANSATADTLNEPFQPLVSSSDESAHAHLVEEHEHSVAALWSACYSPIARSMPKIGAIAWQLCAVYFLEYVISVGFAAKSASNVCSDVQKHAGQCTWWNSNAYEVLAFCYQLGVLISRSSISWFHIPRLWTMTLVQAINFVLWCIHAQHPFMALGFQFAHMVFVGLIGGAMYVNSFYAIMIDESIVNEQRETCLNVVSLFINVGIVTSAFFEIIASATFLK
jgi:battenin